MANAWDVADVVLQEQLEKWRAFVLTEIDYRCHLYQNDYTPIPGSAIGDYTEATFTGYVLQQIDNAEWGAVAMGGHVASMTQNLPCVFEAAAAGFVSQTIYGYYVTNSEGDYLWGERFAVTKTIVPEDVLNVTPVIRHGVLPAP